jgi:hypothetical protein
MRRGAQSEDATETSECTGWRDAHAKCTRTTVYKDLESTSQLLVHRTQEKPKQIQFQDADERDTVNSTNDQHRLKGLAPTQLQKTLSPNPCHLFGVPPQQGRCLTVHLRVSRGFSILAQNRLPGGGVRRGLGAPGYTAPGAGKKELERPPETFSMSYG